MRQTEEAPRLNQSVTKASRILDALCEGGFRAKSLGELFEATGIGTTTAWRLLRTLEADGWVEATGDGRSSRWRVGRKFLEVAFAYRRQALGQVQNIETEYRQISGEELRA